MKSINYGQSLAYIILSANKLGGNFGYSEECNKIIHNKKIMNTFCLSLERTANEAKNWLVKNNLATKAQKIVDHYINEGE